MGCIRCNTEESDQGSLMSCDSCLRTLHKKCSGLCSSEIKVMELKGRRRLKFYCDECMEGLLQVPKLIKIVEELKSEIATMREGAGADQRDLPPRQLSVLGGDEDLVSEMMDRQSRLSNVIIAGVKEPSRNTGAERKAEDSETVRGVLHNTGLDTNNFRLFRLGRFSANKNRPIKVVLNSIESAKYVLKNRQKINIPGVRIFGDQTKSQREYYKKVECQLQELVDAGDETKVIRYIHGRPTIVTRTTPTQRKN